MKKKIPTWPMFLYAYSWLIIIIFIMDYFVVCLSSVMDSLPLDINELVIPFMFYHMALIIAPIYYVVERYVMNDKNKIWVKVILYLGTFVATFLIASLNLEIKLKNYLIFMIIYVVIFTIVSIKYKLPKSLKKYLD